MTRGKKLLVVLLGLFVYKYLFVPFGMKEPPPELREARVIGGAEFLTKSVSNQGAQKGSWRDWFDPDKLKSSLESNRDLVVGQLDGLPGLDVGLARSFGLTVLDRQGQVTKRVNFQFEEGKLVYQELLPEECSDIAVLPAETEADAARWRELAEVLVTELRIAAGRTTVSSVPAFLAEHLRRRLWKLENRKQPPPAAEGGEAAEPGVSREEARECPDCWGTGMYYPSGFEKGVARCRHERLRPGTGGANETRAGE